VLGVALTLLTTACMGDDEDASAPTTRPAATGAEETATTTARPLPPSDFAAEAASFSVELSWAHPPGDAEAERYALYRDGSILITMSGSEKTFTDDSVVPGRQYVYEIEARSGDATSDRIPATAETPVPTLRAARLAGAFNVRTRTLSQSGYVSYQAPVFGWSFKPRCRAGACEVRWSDLHRKRIRATLERRGARYRGSYTGTFTTQCAGTPATSSVEIEFKVVAARVIGREWRATRIVGTLDQSEPVQLGCTSSSATHSLRARLVR
jgi:hypothetical protein